jgi:hypothetical protein
MRDIFEKQAFGELERFITQKLLDVTKHVAKEELKNENWLRAVAKLRDASYEELRAVILEFLDTDVFNISPEHCSAFMDPLIASWDIQLESFDMEVALNPQLTSAHYLKFEFIETAAGTVSNQEPGFQEFLLSTALSGDATEAELAFLRALKFRERRPTALYYYRELQNLRDPLHFDANTNTVLPKRRDLGGEEKRLQIDSRKSAIQRWAKNKAKPRTKAKSQPETKSRTGRKNID